METNNAHRVETDDSGRLPFLYTSSSNVDINKTGTVERKLRSRNRRVSTTQRE